MQAAYGCDWNGFRRRPRLSRFHSPSRITPQTPQTWTAAPEVSLVVIVVVNRIAHLVALRNTVDNVVTAREAKAAQEAAF